VALSVKHAGHVITKGGIQQGKNLGTNAPFAKPRVTWPPILNCALQLVVIGKENEVV